MYTRKLILTFRLTHPLELYSWNKILFLSTVWSGPSNTSACGKFLFVILSHYFMGVSSIHIRSPKIMWRLVYLLNRRLRVLLMIVSITDECRLLDSNSNPGYSLSEFKTSESSYKIWKVILIAFSWFSFTVCSQLFDEPTLRADFSPSQQISVTNLHLTVTRLIHCNRV